MTYNPLAHDRMSPGGKRPRVLLTVLHFHRRGGLEIYTWELACALRRLGWDVTLVSCLQPGAGPCEGFPHIGLAPEDPELCSAHTEQWPMALERYLATRQPAEDLVIAAHPFTLPQVGPYARRHGVPSSVFFYGVDGWDLYDSLKEEIRQGGTVVSISRYTAERIDRHVTPAAGPIQLLPPPVDADRYYPAPKRNRLPRVVLTVSRLSMRDWFKGHEVVIEALGPVMKQLGEPVEYWIVGEGPYRDHLARRAEALGVGERVRFLGFVETERLPDIYREADLFVMPSELGRQDNDMAAGEGFGMVFTEAAACGTPCVGLADGGAAEAVLDGVSGLAVPRRENVEGAMLRPLQDGEERRRLGESAARWAHTEFAYPAFDARLKRILEVTLQAVSTT